jgi:hypothetical protein
MQVLRLRSESSRLKTEAAKSASALAGAEGELGELKKQVAALEHELRQQQQQRGARSSSSAAAAARDAVADELAGALRQVYTLI